MTSSPAPAASIAEVDPRDPLARQALGAYLAEVAARFESAFDPGPVSDAGHWLLGRDATSWSVAASPWHAVLATMRPASDDQFALGPFTSPAGAYSAVAVGLAFLLNLIAILRVRVWNPTPFMEMLLTKPADIIDVI